MEQAQNQPLPLAASDRQVLRCKLLHPVNNSMAWQAPAPLGSALHMAVSSSAWAPSSLAEDPALSSLLRLRASAAAGPAGARDSVQPSCLGAAPFAAAAAGCPSIASVPASCAGSPVWPPCLDAAQCTAGSGPASGATAAPWGGSSCCGESITGDELLQKCPACASASRGELLLAAVDQRAGRELLPGSMRLPGSDITELAESRICLCLEPGSSCGSNGLWHMRHLTTGPQCISVCNSFLFCPVNQWCAQHVMRAPLLLVACELPTMMRQKGEA